MSISRFKLAVVVLEVLLTSGCVAGAIDVPSPASQGAVPPEPPAGIRLVQLPHMTPVAASPGEDTPKTEPPAIATGTSSPPAENTSIAPDRVEVVLFHQRILCSCMAVQANNIENAVKSNFANQLGNGKLAIVDVVIDDGANKALVRKYDATSFDLYIRTVKGDNENIYPINYVIGWTDQPDKLNEFFKKTLGSVLGGGLP
jgi:hypothetical protein